MIRYCLDWTEQRHHLAGALGAAVAGRLFELGWLSHAPRANRAVQLTGAGRAGLATVFALRFDEAGTAVPPPGDGVPAATPPRDGVPAAAPRVPRRRG